MATLVFRWVNRKDPNGRNIFTGGFLGLDNIGEASSIVTIIVIVTISRVSIKLWFDNINRHLN